MGRVRQLYDEAVYSGHLLISDIGTLLALLPSEHWSYNPVPFDQALDAGHPSPELNQGQKLFVRCT